MTGDYKPQASGLWDAINRTQISKEQIQDLTNFKSSPVNFKIALWNPHTNGVRYVKAISYLLCTQLSPENWERLSRIKNRQLGNPFTVTYNGQEVCLDYLQAVHELDFIAKSLNLDGRRILEIGAGYGRTCHAILANHDVEAYDIVDLENCLQLSRSYLASVLDQASFSKIRFICVEDFGAAPVGRYDLSINIDSFAEMNADVVHYYLNYINEHSKHFYVKNPVGKYLDASLDDSLQNTMRELALKTGVLRDVIEIHDSNAVRDQVPKFVAAYRPGSSWQSMADTWAIPWSYYWQALYKRDE